MRGHSHLKEEALDRTMWRARFGKVFGPVVRQTTKFMNECLCLLREHTSTRSVMCQSDEAFQQALFG